MLLDCDPDDPSYGKGQGHRDSDREHLVEHGREASGSLQGGEEREAPHQLTIDDMVYDEHQSTAPKHFFEVGYMAPQRGLCSFVASGCPIGACRQCLD